MSTHTFTDVGVSLSGFGLEALLSKLLQKTSRTTLIEPFVEPDVVSVIDAWDAGASATVDTRPYPKDAVDAVEFIRDLLNVSLNDVFKATGVSERTFHGWKSRGHKPQAGSLGGLWPMADTLWYLANSHPNLEAWFHSSNEAKAAFGRGDSNQLALLEFDWAARTYPPQHRLTADFEADTDDGTYLPTGTLQVLDSEVVPESSMTVLPLVHDDGR